MVGAGAAFETVLPGYGVFGEGAGDGQGVGAVRADCGLVWVLEGGEMGDCIGRGGGTEEHFEWQKEEPDSLWNSEKYNSPKLRNGERYHVTELFYTL